MLGPVWARWLVVAAMAAVTTYHLVRAGRSWYSTCRPLSDLWHASMGVGMALMALGVTDHGPAWWLMAFAIPTLRYAGRGLDRYVVSGIGVAASDLRRVIAGLAMCWMLTAPMEMTMLAGSGAVGGMAGVVAQAQSSHPHRMGAMTGGAVPIASPTIVAGLLGSVTVLLLVAVVALAARSGRTTVRAYLAHAGRIPPLPQGPGPGSAARHGCQTAMHVTAAVMLAAML